MGEIILLNIASVEMDRCIICLFFKLESICISLTSLKYVLHHDLS